MIPDPTRPAKIRHGKGMPPKYPQKYQFQEWRRSQLPYLVLIFHSRPFQIHRSTLREHFFFSFFLLTLTTVQGLPIEMRFYLFFQSYQFWCAQLEEAFPSFLASGTPYSFRLVFRDSCWNSALIENGDFVGDCLWIPLHLLQRKKIDCEDFILVVDFGFWMLVIEVWGCRNEKLGLSWTLLVENTRKQPFISL